VKFGRTLTNRYNLAYTIPLITLTIILVISVVKSSLALSLGLVGALSIVRFRTPVKETEELAYLFIAVGIGIALGADQIVPTLMATAVILIFATLRSFVWRKESKQNLYLNIELTDVSTDRETLLQTIVGAITPSVSEIDLRRFDINPELVQATFYIECKDDEAIASTITALQWELPGVANITFLDQSIG
jgi:uncharacterized membrane protein YhiD involved in acid resistance